jgi:glycerophosphoryl diester phosphodiesterase
VHPRYGLVNAARVAKWHAAGLFVHAYTVNDGQDVRRLQQAGVDGIITDDVPLILDALSPGA